MNKIIEPHVCLHIIDFKIAISFTDLHMFPQHSNFIELCKFLLKDPKIIPVVLTAFVGSQVSVVNDVTEDSSNNCAFMFQYEVLNASTSLTDISSPPEIPPIIIADVSF